MLFNQEPFVAILFRLNQLRLPRNWDLVVPTFLYVIGQTQRRQPGRFAFQRWSLLFTNQLQIYINKKQNKKNDPSSFFTPITQKTSMSVHEDLEKLILNLTFDLVHGHEINPFLFTPMMFSGRLLPQCVSWIEYCGA